VVYLQARVEIILERIKHRGRTFEKNIDAAYIKRVLTAYNDYFFWYSETPLLVVDTSDINLVDSDDDFLDLSRTVLRHRKGTQFYRPLGR
jgi:deoxyguanosine kinase